MGFERPDQTSQSSSSSSDAVPVFLPFPGNEKSYKRPPRQAVQQAPTFTVKSGEPFTMPLQKLGGKEYYIGIFFKANWNSGEPNNFQYENGETENCLELWNRDGKGLRWNDTPCSFESYFVCEV